MRRLLKILFVLILGVTLAELWVYLRIQRTSDVTLQPNLSSREFTLATPKAQTTPSLRQSSINKWSATPIKIKGMLVWQDGMFLYKAADSAVKNTLPYALVGKVKNIDGREIDIYSGLDEVKVRLLEKYGEVTQIRRNRGEITFTKDISYEDIKAGDTLEVYSLKPIAENYFSTSQIFVLLPET